MNAFTLFGEIKADTGAFEKSLYDSNKRLLETEKALDKVVDKSIELGDTSATVGRRYEKLNEQIAAQKTRLLDAAVAYEKNDITAKQYATTVISVHKQVDTLTARIKDAAARTRELDETGLTHFQNQIKGATSAVQDNINALIAARQTASSVTVQNKGNDLFGNLSGFQKKQLSFQANDVITGLLSGQPITQILAQQGGQIVQIFQQGKSAAEGTAAATSAAAVAETQFAASAKAAAVAQGEVAVASEATAAATTEAAGAITVFGVALGPVIAAVAAVAAIASTYVVMKKVGEEIRAVGEGRLKNEEAIAASLNEQYLTLTKLKGELSTEQSGRDFGRFLENAGTFELLSARDNLQRQFEQNAQGVVSERNRRASSAGSLSGSALTQYLADAKPAGFDKAQEDLASTIKGLTERLDKTTRPQSSADFIKDVQDKQLALFSQGLKDQVQAQKDAQKAAKDLAEAHKKAAEAAKQEAEKRQRLIDTLTKEDAGRFDRSLDSYKLRREAREFEQGYKFGPQSVSEKLQDQLSALGASFGTKEIYNGTVSGGDRGPSILSRTIANLTSLTDAQKEAYYKDVVKVTDGLRPEELDAGQRNIAAQARRYLADKDDKETKDIFKKLSDAISTGNIVTFKDESNSVKSIQKATPAATAQRY